MMKVPGKLTVICVTTLKDGTITGINDYGCGILGCSGGSCAGMKIQDFHAHPVDRSLYLKRLETDGFVKDFEIRLRGADGSVITCLENAVLEESGNPGTAYIESFIIDISGFVDSSLAAIKLNIQLSELNKKLKDAYNTMSQQEKLASVGELAAGVAHEINNPLGFVMSNSRSLKRYIETVRSFLDSISDKDGIGDLMEENNIRFILDDLDDILGENNDGLERIARITESLKRFSRMDNNSMTDDYDLNQAVRDTLTIAKPHYKYTADIETDLGDIPPVSCYGDALNQVILNLIVNASQAADREKSDEKGKIVITTGVDGSYVFCRVSDNGPGVPDELVPRIFDPFFTTKEVGRGTGLGLSLCFDIIVQKHSGSIWYERNSKGGADFIFKIPLKLESEQ